MYLVTGATGALGRRVVRLLRERDQPVRSFVRLSSKYAELENRGSEIFIGNLREERDIQKACRRVKYVISCHGSGSDAQELDYRANVDLIDQAKAAGVEHFVFISVLGADRGYEDATVFKAKREVEKYLQTSGLNYTILRPSGLASSLLPLAERFKQTGLYLLTGDPKNRTSIVSTDDLARIAVESPVNMGAKNRTFPVGGPDILKREDIPRIFGRLFNREPIIINAPLMVLDGIRGSLSFVNPALAGNLGTLRALVATEFYCTANEIDTLETIYNFKLESVETFLRRYLGT